jgi:hypothetical protein
LILSRKSPYFYYVEGLTIYNPEEEATTPIKINNDFFSFGVMTLLKKDQGF